MTLSNRKSLISGVLFLEVGICILIDGLQVSLNAGFQKFSMSHALPSSVEPAKAKYRPFGDDIP